MPRPKQSGIPISDILPIYNPHDYKVHFAIYNQIKQPLDVFVNDWSEWERWNCWNNPKRNDFNRRQIFSLIRFYPRKDTWLFGGIFIVLGRRTEKYNIELSGLYAPYIGRLLVDYKGPGTRGRSFKFENHYTKLIVSQILESRYGGED